MQYSEKKAAQIAAFFVFQEGSVIGILKLMKLMYLAERESFTKYGEPMIGDNLVSMNHGPVLSITLDHLNNFIDSEPGGWESWISDRENHFVGLKVNIEGDIALHLDQLSDADLDVLLTIWKKYGKYSGSQLRNITHEICTEWEDSDNSSLPIPYSRLLKCVGYDPETTRELVQRINEQRKLDEIFSVTPTRPEIRTSTAG